MSSAIGDIGSTRPRDSSTSRQHVERRDRVAEHLGEPGEDQVAHRVPGERAGAAEAVLHDLGPRPDCPGCPAASAARAIRRSPGGITPSSARSRPDEPPSSATVTTAVTSIGEPPDGAERGVQSVPSAERDDRGPERRRRAAMSSVRGHSRPRSRCTTCTARPASCSQTRGECFGHGHASVLAAGASRPRSSCSAFPPDGIRPSSIPADGDRCRGSPRHRRGTVRNRGPRRPVRCAGAVPGSSGDSGRNRTSHTRSASIGRPYLNPNDSTVTLIVSDAASPKAASIFWRSSRPDSVDVSMTRSAAAFTGASCARSAAIPSERVPSALSLCSG